MQAGTRNEAAARMAAHHLPPSSTAPRHFALTTPVHLPPPPPSPLSPRPPSKSTQGKCGDAKALDLIVAATATGCTSLSCAWAVDSIPLSVKLNLNVS